MRMLFYILILIPFFASAQENLPTTMTASLHPSIQTLQVHPADAAENVYEGAPVIDIASGDKIVVSFDEISEDRSYLRYELIHCDAFWNPDRLVDSEFLDGFNQATIDDYAFSGPTTVHYVNYRIVLPNEQMQPLISGNYLMRIYNENEPDSTLALARFSINENSAGINASVTSRTDYDFNNKHQQVSVVVDTERIQLRDPYNDLRIVVEQDGRTDNAVIVSHPMAVEGTKVIFDHNRDLTFKAGNEYRRFEVINENLPGQHVDYVSYFPPFYHFTLSPDYPRCESNYEYDLSRYGRYVVRRQNAQDCDTDAEYVVVHFSLLSPEISDYDIYIEGDLTNRRFNSESLMSYNPESGSYEKALLLKQGAYSYQYVAKPKGNPNSCGSTEIIEGDYYPTGHEYTIKAYYRLPGERYDRLAGYTTIYSNQ